MNQAISQAGWRLDNSYAELPSAFFWRGEPVPVRQAQPVIVNHGLAERLGIRLDAVDPAIFAGNKLPEGAAPIAQAYAGHQFGNFTMLGDGRAILLGEQIAPDGRRFDIQLKGSGPTPYSRNGDGRAALGPMLREYVISEAMAALGIPTTRSLAVVATGEPVFREELLPGAVLTRVAASHIRVGTFEFAAARGDIEGLRQLVDHVIGRHYPELAEADNRPLALLDAVIARQAALIVEWMRVGFIHGVMNTDNMTLSGETIDYGPCAFMDHYDPATTFSSIDRRRRYAYGNQPPIAQWNLARLAESLLALIDADEEKAVERASERIGHFKEIYEAGWKAMMARKLGLDGEEEGDASLLAELLDWMKASQADYTNTFLALAGTPPLGGYLPATIVSVAWLQRRAERIARQSGGAARAADLMAAANPVYIPRNHKVEEALSAATGEGDLAPFHRLLEVVTQPYALREGLEAWQQPMPDGASGYRTFCGT